MNEAPNDTVLLAEAARGSAQAIRSVIERHATLVYSAAYRVLANRADAEDASQIVFSIFQRKAKTLPAATVLAGWFHRATWFVAQALKDDLARRRRHEKEAAAMRTTVTPAPEVWLELRPLLDEALNALPEKSRLAVVLHHLEGQPLRDVGKAIGCSEDAARKRVDWALGKMRTRLERRGVILATGLLAASISAHAAESVPPSLLSTSGSESMFAALNAQNQRVAEEAMRAMHFSETKATHGVMAAVVAMLLLAAVISASDVAPPPAPAVTGGGHARPAEERRAPHGSWSVNGTVTDEAGKPIEGAYVALGGNRSYQTMARRHPEPWRPLAHLTKPFFDHEPCGPSTRSNAKGEYIIKDIEGPIQGSIVAYHPDYVPAWVEIERRMVASSGEIQCPAITVREGNAISGKVIDEAGNAIARAYVAVQPALIHARNEFGGDGSWEDRPPYEYRIGDVRVVRSDENGGFCIQGLVPQAYAIAAWTDDRPPVARNVNAAGSDGAQVIIALQAGKTLTVRTVLLPDRRPLPGCFIGVEGLQWLKTNERGECVLAGLPDGEHVIIAGPPEGSAFHGGTPRATYTFEYAQRKTCNAGDEVTFEFLPDHALRVRLIDSESKAPVTQAQIRLEPKWNDENRKYGDLPSLSNAGENTAADGVFSIHHVRRAEWTLRVLGNGYLPLSQIVSMPLEGLKDAVELALQPAKAELRGRVVDAQTGKPLAAVKVWAYEWLADFGDGNRQETLTRDDGSYKLTRLYGGKQVLRLTFSREKYVSQIVEVTAESPRPANELMNRRLGKSVLIQFPKDQDRPNEIPDVRLTMEAHIRGLIRGPDGKGLRNYAIMVYYGGEAKNLKASIFGGSHTAVDGSFEVTLPSGRYDLAYGHRDWQRETALEIKPGETLQLDLLSDGSPAEEDF